jgi:hypothetical protein
VKQTVTGRPGVLLVVIGMIVGLAGCGQPVDIDTFTLPPISTKPTSLMFVIAPPASLAIDATTTVSAAVTNFSANAVIAWSATCGSAGACGSFSFSQTASGGNTNYLAPSAIPSSDTVTITATLVGDTTQNVSAKISITRPQPIAVAFQGVPPASLQVNATVPLSAQITNDVSGNPQVKWTVACTVAPCGSFNPVTTNNEAATNYTAPSAVPTGNNVTITATSVTDPTKSVSATITITQAAATLASGTYVFQLSGPVGPAANFVSGVIIAQNGQITGGEQDFIDYAANLSAQTYLPRFDEITGGTYATTPDGNLQITLNTNDSIIGIAGVETMKGVIISSSRVLLTQINGSVGSGTLDLQTSTAAPSGGYAFTTFGVDLNGEPAGIGGVLDVNAGEIVTANSVLDINDNFVFSPAQTLAATVVSGPDTLGRVEFQLAPAAPSAFQSINLAGYVVDAAHIRLIETANDTFQGVMGGTALGQGSNTGAFTSSSIAGSSFVFGTAGEEMNAGSLQVAGVFTANSGGTLNGTLNWNDLTGTAVQSPIAFSGSYAVDPSGTGRVALSNLTDGSTFAYQFELYLTGSGQGLLLSSSTAEMIAGRAFEQTSAASFSGSYGMSSTEIASGLGTLGANTSIGPITAVAGSGTDTLTGFVDFGSGATDFPATGNATSFSTGIFAGTLAGLNPAASIKPDSFSFYLVDSTQVLIIETDNTQLTLGYLDLLQP